MASRIDIRTAQGSLDLPVGFDKEFYITRQIHNLKNFQSRNADYTKTIKLPATPKNVAILDAISDISGTTTKTNNTIGCSVLMDGITVAPIAKLLYTKSILKEGFAELECTIFYGNFNLFDDLSGQTLDKLNLADMATLWEVPELLIASQKTYLDDTLVFPVVDWTQRNVAINNLINTNIDANLSGFFVYARNIVQRIIEEAGYTMEVQNVPPDFNTIALACPVTKFMDMGDNASLERAGFVNTIIEQTVLGITERAVFDSDIQSSAATFTITEEWQTTKALTTLVSLAGVYSYTKPNPNNLPSRIVMYQNGIEVTNISIDLSGNNVPFYISFNAAAQIGDLFYIELEASNNFLDATLTLEIGAVFGYSPEGSEPNRTVQVSEHIPQIEKGQFIADILKIFNLFMVTNDVEKIVTISDFNQLYTNPEVDLSKRLSGGKEETTITHFLESLGQYSHFKWANDNLLRRDTDDILRFENQTLTKTVDVIAMDYSACDESTRVYTQQVGEPRKAKVPQDEIEFESKVVGITIITNGVEFTVDEDFGFEVGDFFYIDIVIGGPRHYIRVVTKTSGTTGTLQGPITVDSNPRTLTSYLRPKGEAPENRFAILQNTGFEDLISLTQGYWRPTGGGVNEFFDITSFSALWGSNLRMQTITDTYYKNILNALQTPQVITAMFNISVLEVLNWDFTRPIYVSAYNAHYYTNKIEQFKIDNLTRLELIRITDGVAKDTPLEPPTGGSADATLNVPTDPYNYIRMSIDQGANYLDGPGTFTIPDLSINTIFDYSGAQPAGTYNLSLYNTVNDGLIFGVTGGSIQIINIILSGHVNYIEGSDVYLVATRTG